MACKHIHFDGSLWTKITGKNILKTLSCSDIDGQGLISAKRLSLWIEKLNSSRHGDRQL